MNIIKIFGAGLVVMSGLLICICLLRKNEAYFNLRKVIHEHLALFQNCKSQYLVFYGFPLTFAIGLAMLYEADTDFFSELSVILSIITSILFAILSILSGHDYSSVEDKRQKEKAEKVMRETLNAIIFSSVLCVFLLLYGLTIAVASGASFEWLPFDISVVKRIVSALAYYIFTVILLNLFLIIKHMSKLIEFNLHAPKKGDKE